MKLNNTPDSNFYSFQILVTVNVENDNYVIGRFKFEDNEQWKKAKNQIQGDHFHPTDEFANLIKLKCPYLDMDDIVRSIVTFIFVDDTSVIEF